MKDEKIYITFDRPRILRNRKSGKADPPIRVMRGRRGTPGYYHVYEFPGGRAIYSPEKPLSTGAEVWIELDEVKSE